MVPLINRKLHLTSRVITLTHPWLATPFIPFSSELRCFAGEHWFSANSKAVQVLLDFYNTKPSLATHYRQLEEFTTIVPEESYYHTVLCNQEKLRVSQECWRYVVWSDDGIGPKILGLDDLSNMLASKAHFARKFDEEQNKAVFEELDAIIC